MKKINVFICFLLIMVLLLTAGCGQKSTSPAEQGKEQKEDKVIIIKYGTSGPEDHPYTVGARKFEELVNQKSNGKIKVEVYPNNQLGGEREMAEGVKTGTIQMACLTTDGALPAWVPEAQIFTIPYLFRDREHVYKALDGELGKALEAKFLEKGLSIWGLPNWVLGILQTT